MKKDGFSIVELLVAMAIFSLIAAAVMSTLLTAQHSWSTGSGQAMVTSQLRRALDRMSRELVESGSSQLQQIPADGLWYQRMSFRVPEDRSVPPDGSVLDVNGQIAEWSDWITYRSGLAQGRTPSLLREVGPVGGAPVSSEVLANYISSLLFRRQNATPDVVEISLTAFAITGAGQYMPRTMSTRVKLRNG